MKYVLVVISSRPLSKTLVIEDFFAILSLPLSAKLFPGLVCFPFSAPAPCHKLVKQKYNRKRNTTCKIIENHFSITFNMVRAWCFCGPENLNSIWNFCWIIHSLKNTHITYIQIIILTKFLPTSRKINLITGWILPEPDIPFNSPLIIPKCCFPFHLL